jgi:hypothetical protein
MGTADKRHVTVDRLRNDIDSGRTGDKVPGPDPAAAPLGSDDEAAGKPPSRARVELTRELEASTRGNAQAPQRGPGAAWILIAFTAALGTVLIVWTAMQW